MKRRLLIADDHAAALHGSIALVLSKVGDFEIVTAASPVACIDALHSAAFDVVLLDLSFSPGGKEGVDLVSKVKDLAPDAEIIMLTSFDDPLSINQCMAAGAHDYISKNSLNNLNELSARIDAVLKRRDGRAAGDLSGLKLARLVGADFSSKVMREIYTQAVKVRAERRMHVLITGPTGTGKELVARAIGREDEGAPFFPVNSSCFGRDLLESKLFGHERGSFTGADRQKSGIFELASGGDIFLDEIATLSPDHQAKLLRVLQSGEFYRLGGNTLLKTTARVIAATNEDLEALVRQGKFREDLLQRLQRYHIRLPTLSERREDIPAIVASVIAKSGKPQVKIADDCLNFLICREWRRNIRELEDCVGAMIMNCDGAYLTIGDLPRKFFDSATSVAIDGQGVESHGAFEHKIALGTRYQDAVREFSAEYIRATAHHAKWPVTIERLARTLGMPKSTLGKRVLEFGIDLNGRQHS